MLRNDDNDDDNNNSLSMLYVLANNYLHSKIQSIILMEEKSE